MTLVWGRERLHCERSSVAPSVAPPDSSPSPESGDKLFDQPAGPLGTKPSVANALATTNVFKYSKDNLQQILKAVLEARALVPTLAPVPTPAPALASIVAKVPQEKLMACFPDIYHGKSYIDCYNFCQQCKDYFATAKAMRLIRIFFAASFFRDQISFYWQQYKRKQDTDSAISVMWDKFKAFFCYSLGDSQAFMDTY